MTFNPYSKISNVTNRSVERCAALGDIDWIASEKIHGANFSIIITKMDSGDRRVQCARRRGVLLNSGNFYNYQSVMTRDGHEMTLAADRIAARYMAGGADEVAIFGELCGGAYPGRKSKTKAVQWGVYYAPDVAFIAYGIRITTGDEVRYINATSARHWLADEGFKIAPLIARGSLTEMLELSPEFQSRVPALFGLIPPKDNLAEGIVLSPCVDYIEQFSTPRPILKIKAAKSRRRRF